MARLYVILTIAVSREWVGQKPDCNGFKNMKSEELEK